ncbi:hypothetical protein P3T73_00935 [Kiritimatiellota bacterium B12222]|nr:hypothetical protein P3T73_00915 [Kiritimatiellota bacterium B12222]WFB36328.1 hypothetical protein P3T73_00935 [Kiritimatiellota bacterium B12222]
MKPIISNPAKDPRQIIIVAVGVYATDRCLHQTDGLWRKRLQLPQD